MDNGEDERRSSSANEHPMIEMIGTYFLITTGFTVLFILALYGTMLKKQNAGKPFNCGAVECCQQNEKEIER